MAQFYSAFKNVFLDGDLRAEYEAVGSWPSDAVEVSPKIFMDYGCTNPPSGKVRGTDASGNPCWVAAPEPTSEQLWATLREDAKAELASSDIVVLRCYENAVPLPAAWAAYRKALRTIVGASTGDPTQTLPAKPPYPSGT